MKLKTLNNPSENECESYVIVPLFTKYCIYVETNGVLQVDYVFTRKFWKHL